MTRTEHNLPFFELSDRRFEQLCFALLRSEGHSHVRHWGDAGSEGGCDVVSTDEEGRRWVTQAKRTQEFGPTAAVEELVKVLDDPPDPEPAVYLLAASCALSRRTERALRKKIRERGKTWEVKCWGRTELDAKVRAHPDVQRRFFGEPVKLRRPHWNVPNRNAYFTGREDLLAALDERLEEAGTAALTQAITGLGGVGKTQIAVEFCHRHRQRYDGGVYWTDASSADALLAAYAGFAVAQSLARQDDPVEEAAARFRRWLATEDGWLLVLDNADAPGEVCALLPTSASGHVIVTTRARVPGLGRDPLPVDVLPPNEATGLLLDRGGRGNEERAAARDLAGTLGYLPLALEQAGAYLAHNQATVADYLASFRQRRLKVVEKQAPEQGDYGATVATTWDMSFQRVERASPAAAEALRACAFLAPDGIPLKLFTSTGNRLGPALGALAEETAEDPLTVHELLVEPLTRYSLVTFEPVGSEFSIHRLVQETIRNRLASESQSSEVLERVHSALEVCFPRDAESPASWPEGALLLPHVQSAFNVWRSNAEEPNSDPTALWLRAGEYAWTTGRAPVARKLEKKALSVRRRVLGEEHPDTLKSMCNLAETLRVLGDAAAARELHEKALSLRRRVLGEEHPDTLTSMNNLALTLWDLGDAAAARELLEEVLTVLPRVVGEEHPNTLQSMNNLALTLWDLGDAAAARELHEEVLSIRRRVLGEEHPDTLNSMNNLAESLRALGDATGARELHEEALSGRRRVLGEEHPHMLRSMSNLAKTLRDLGDAVAARELHEVALSVQCRVLGKEHPDTLRSMHNLCFLQAESADMEVDRELVATLLAGVRKLPEATPVRVEAEARWGTSGE